MWKRKPPKRESIMGLVEKERGGYKPQRTVPKGVYEVLRTGESPIPGMTVKVSGIENSNGHIITYEKKK